MPTPHPESPALLRAAHDLARTARAGGPRRVTPIELAAPAAGAALAAQVALAGAPVVYLTADEDDATSRARDIAFLATWLARRGSSPPLPEDGVVELPGPEPSPYRDSQPDRRALQRRLAVLARLSGLTPPRVLVASAPALCRRVLPRATLRALSVTVRRDGGPSREELVALCRAAGYALTPLVEDPGTFAVRGAIVDLFSPIHSQPVRVEFLGDDIESLRTFDAASQRTLRPVEFVQLVPVRETLRSPGADPAARLLEVAERCQVPSSLLRELHERLTEGTAFLGLDALAPLFHAQMDSLLDYLPSDVLLLVERPDDLLDRIGREHTRLQEACARRRAEHRLALDPEEYCLAPEAVRAGLARFARAELERPTPSTATATAWRIPCTDHTELRADLARARATVGTRATAGPPEAMARIAERAQRWLDEGHEVCVVAPNPTHADRVAGLLRAAGLPLAPPGGEVAARGHATAARGVAVLVGELREGFALPADGIVLLTEADLFGRRALREARAPGKHPPAQLATLREGDAVVHDEHGVGRYRGLRTLELRGVRQDFLHIEYDGGTIYLPVYRIGQLGRFTAAGEGTAVRLDKLGGATWQAKKRKARAEARKLAEDLLQLYAERATRTGAGCPPPDSLFHAFEETFPFEETPDQERAIADVLADLQADTPMDRLICGDVGYGKTEVAMRAALLAVEAGRQVAVLAPTTVLCEQHARSFAERFSGFPVRVAALSRFRGPAEQQRTLAGLAAGELDVVVGTHRLLSRDVQWKNLGLVVIDEEQRFGVAHKERLKQLRAEVDVLTLTATPIPRTLQLALGGLRPMSVIATPPADRLAIRTFVCGWDAALLGEAIARELERGGQVFFVHNRIEDLERWAAEVQALAPRARIAVAHGRMREATLERTMLDFVAGKFDVLCSTTIVESGLDIPRANTLIVHRAEQLGLAQLYQLRGRIGRSPARAYCYLVVSGERAPTAEAEARLAALERFSELGSGFHLAYADLEIRGAGEFLGARQSGVVAGIGFEAYARLLEDAVAELQGLPLPSARRARDPEIAVDVPAYLPDDYIPEPGQRLELYRRLAQAETAQDVTDILDEITDRFGPLPAEAVLLGQVMADKTLVRRLGARAYELGPQRLVLTLDPDAPLPPARIAQLVRAAPGRWRLTPDRRLLGTFDADERRDRLAAARTRLLELERLLVPEPPAAPRARRHDLQGKPTAG